MLKRTTPLRQQAPMKRTGWMRTTREKKAPGLAQRIAEALGFAIKHERAESSVFRSQTHLQNVASLNCISCGRPQRSQAAHTNMLALGKGKGMKASDALTFPLCASGLLVIGCHAMLDQGGAYSKAASREVQLDWLVRTRDKLLRLGQWPAAAENDFEKFVVSYLNREGK